MTKLAAGSKVFIHLPSIEDAEKNAIHLLDPQEPLFGEVVYVHESGNVNVVAYDQVGTPVKLLDIATTKGKGNEIYVTSSR